MTIADGSPTFLLSLIKHYPFFAQGEPNAPDCAGINNQRQAFSIENRCRSGNKERDCKASTRSPFPYGNTPLALRASDYVGRPNQMRSIVLA